MSHFRKYSKVNDTGMYTLSLTEYFSIPNSYVFREMEQKIAALSDKSVKDKNLLEEKLTSIEEKFSGKNKTLEYEAIKTGPISCCLITLCS